MPDSNEPGNLNQANTVPFDPTFYRDACENVASGESCNVSCRLSWHSLEYQGLQSAIAFYVDILTFT